MRAALAARDIGEMYRTLTNLGVSQRQIATLVGQSQSELSEIIKGRVVKDYRLLERIAEGLGIPRELIGLSWYGSDGASAYPGPITVQPPEGVTEAMRRRALLAAAGVAVVGQPIKQLGELLDLPGPPPVGLPSRVSSAHVTKVRDLTQSLLAAGDAYLQSLALTYAGLATEEHGHPDDGLKMLQLAQVKAWDLPHGQDRRNAVEATALAYSVNALAQLGHPDAADAELVKSRELWQPSNPYGDPDRVAALLEADRGHLDAAESFAQASVRRWEGGVSELGRTHSSVVLATIHVQVSEPDGIGLAHGAITAVTKLSSVRARKRLEPLASALDTRRGSDARDLARMARQVAATRV